MDDQGEEDFYSENFFELAPRLRADFLHPPAAAANEDAFLGVPLDVDDGMDSKQVRFFFEAFDEDGDRMGNFVVGVGDDLFADNFGGQKSLGLIGHLLRRK